ncbi:MAG: DUF4407 domain-containing protein [Mesorhizobium sp.]
MDAFLYFVAGVDRRQIEICPETDRILARQLGIMLTLTFIIVISITFYSLSYIGNSSVQYDAATNTFKPSENSISLGGYIFICVISLVIAMIITLFDRMLYQSDWFYQLPIADVENTGQNVKLKFFIKKTWRVFTRLLISLAVAYSLSTFLELKVFESQIVKKNQEIYLARNQRVFDDIQAEAARLTMRIDGVSSEIAALRERSVELQRGGLTIDPGLAAKLSAIERELTDIDANATRQYSALRSRADDELSSLLAKGRELAPLLREATANVALFTDYMNAEIGGVNPEGLPGISEQEGCGRRCEYWKAKRTQAQAEEARLRTLVEENETAIGAIRSSISAATEENDALIAARKRILLSQRDEIFSRAETESARMEKDHQQRIRDNTERLSTKEFELATLRSSYNGDLDLFVLRRQASPDYVPFSDGPLERLTALLELKTDVHNGATITWFSWWVKGFVIFLELAPVLSKMFFAPPSVYGFRIRSNVAAGQIEQIDIANSRAAASRAEYVADAAKLDAIVWERQSRAHARKAFDDGERDLFAARKQAS